MTSVSDLEIQEMMNRSAQEDEAEEAWNKARQAELVKAERRATYQELKAKLGPLMAQQEQLRLISEQLRSLAFYMNEKLTMNLNQHILSFGPHGGYTLAKMCKRSPIFEDCWSLTRIGTLQVGDPILLRGMSENDPPMLPIFPEGAVYAHRVDVGETVSEMPGWRAALSMRTGQDFGSMVEIAWNLHLRANISDGCLKPGQQGEVLSFGPTYFFVRCNGECWCYNKSAVHLHPPVPTLAILGNDEVDAIPVIQEVQHNDTAAVISAQEAQLISATASSTWLQQNSESSVDPCEWLVQSAHDEDMERILVLQISRNPKEFQDTLLRADALEHVRHCLDSEGYDVILPCGALIFVSPLHYTNVRDTIQKQHKDLKCYHVIVSESLVSLVKEALQAIPSQLNVRIRDSRTRVVACAGQSKEELYIVENTFLVAVRAMRGAQSVNQSTTEAHGSINPRRRTSSMYS